MKSTLTPDITPQSHPDHHVVGQDVMGWSMKRNEAARFHCYSHDASGYNLVDRADPEDHKNVSERVIGRTFHLIHDMGAGRETSAWGAVTIGQDGKIKPSAYPTMGEDAVQAARGWSPDVGLDDLEIVETKPSEGPSPFFEGKPTLQ
jgi:hypothetical protein